MFKKGIVYQDFLAQEKNEKKEKQNIYKQILDVQVYVQFYYENKLFLGQGKN